jgi:hypothetical protein
VKLPAHRAGLPGKVFSFYIVPLDPAYKAWFAGHIPVNFPLYYAKYYSSPVSGKFLEDVSFFMRPSKNIKNKMKKHYILGSYFT